MVVEIFHYSPHTGELLGAGISDDDPLDLENTLIPAYSTKLAPPETGPREAAVFTEGSWQVVPDWRDFHYWMPNGNSYDITELGVAPPEDYLEEEPVQEVPLIDQFINGVQNHLDTAARELGYDDLKTAVTYAEEPAVPKFQKEGRAFRTWRSLCWDFCYKRLDDVNAGLAEIPTSVEAFIGELPPLVMEV